MMMMMIAVSSPHIHSPLQTHSTTSIFQFYDYDRVNCWFYPLTSDNLNFLVSVERMSLPLDLDSCSLWGLSIIGCNSRTCNDVRTMRWNEIKTCVREPFSTSHSLDFNRASTMTEWNRGEFYYRGIALMFTWWTGPAQPQQDHKDLIVVHDLTTVCCGASSPIVYRIGMPLPFFVGHFWLSVVPSWTETILFLPDNDSVTHSFSLLWNSMRLHFPRIT